MSLLDELGVVSVTPKEYEAKQTAVKSGASRRLTSIIQSATDEFQIVDVDFSNAQAEFAWHMDAQNHLLALLNFPNKLKPFLDAIIGASGSAGQTVFTATNWEIGQRSRSGREACSDGAMEKWVSRQKRKLDEWQSFKNFHFVSIEQGAYDFEKKKRYPTKYKINFNKYVCETVAVAKTKFYWRGSSDKRRFQGRALREAARQILNEIPEAPPWRITPVKTLSEEEKFDRRHKQILTFLEKNKAALERVGLDAESYFMYCIRQLDQIATNSTEAFGLLTPDDDRATREFSVWAKIKTGEINNDIEDLDAHLDEKLDRMDRAGYNQVEYVALKAEETPKQADISVHEPENQGECLTLSDQADISGETAKPLKTHNQTKRTFLENHTDTFVPLVEEKPEVLNTFGNQLVDLWKAQIREKIPDPTFEDRFSNQGCWEIIWNSPSRAARDKNAALDGAISMFDEDFINAGNLRTVFIEWIIARLARYRKGVPVALLDSQTKAFENRLEGFLKIPDG